MFDMVLYRPPNADDLLVRCMPVLVHVNPYFDILVPYLDVFHADFVTDIEQHFANFT